MQVIGLNAGAAMPAAVIDASLATIDALTQTQITAPAAIPESNVGVVTTASADATPADWELVGDNVQEVPVRTLVRRRSVVLIKHIIPGDNPRKYFDGKEMDDITASVRLHGILQSIVLRPLGEESFAIIAGERRYRAALTVYGEDHGLSVEIIECTEEEAVVLANIENTQRADMSATEEGLSAAKILGDVKGDRNEAARLLSWSRGKLDSRLALMNCSEPVQKALNERQIKLGHAELFASLSKENQNKLLPAVLERGLGVPDLKSLIEKAASKLAGAIFDKTDCAGCQHNSSVQGTMFDACITDGSCTNSSCFKTKTEAALEGIKDSLKDEYPVIRIVRAGDNFAQVRIRAEQVGAVQAEACRGCANFGAAVSAIPEHLGKTFKDQCFDTGCNQKMIAENIRVQNEAKAVLAKASAGNTTPKDTPKGAADGKEAVKAPVVATSVREGDKVKEYRVALWRKAMKKEVSRDYAVSVNYLIALAVTGNVRHINSGEMTQVFEHLSGEKKGSDLIAVANQVQQLPPERIDTAVKMLAVTAMIDLPEAELVRMAKHVKLDLTKHWKLDAAFLKLLTKSEIQVVAKSIGLDKAFGSDFGKLWGEKKDPLIEKLLGLKDFDYSAKIPSSLNYK